MKVATWNVNSINARLPLVLEWIDHTRPDVILLQELKCLTEKFPAVELEDAGYNLAIHGQKTYNGVAILSKHPLEDILIGLPHESSGQARYIEAFTGGVRVASVYVPNGQTVGSPAYTMKLAFFEHLRHHVSRTLHPQESFILGGDFNVAPTDRDVYDPEKWRGHVLVSEPERYGFRQVIEAGLTDAEPHLHPHPTEPPYTWWDYRTGGWRRNHGLRIDHLLVSPHALTSLRECGVDRLFRGRERPSDHAPVWCTLN